MNLEKVLNKQFPITEQTLTEKDCMLYALGIGLGADPIDPKQLQFVYEKNLKVFPSQSMVIAPPDIFWVTEPELDIDYVKLLHGEEIITQHQPLQAGHTYTADYRIAGVVDKGESKGAVLYLEKNLTDKDSGDCVSQTLTAAFLRGDGGCGSSGYSPPQPAPLPEGKADKTLSIKTASNAALIYRLSGDYNPLHSDPAVAAKAGFERPILHGMCTLGIATRAVLDTYCNSQPEQLESIRVRFSQPVYPGETVSVECWQSSAGSIHFAAFVEERMVRVLNQGLAKIKT